MRIALWRLRGVKTKLALIKSYAVRDACLAPERCGCKLFSQGKKRVCKTSKAHVGPKKATISSLKKQLLKGNSGIFKHGPYINMYCCVNASDIAWFFLSFPS